VTDGRDGIEILRQAAGRAFRCVLLDFDGTISLIRQGWQDVMIPLMVEVIRRQDHGLTDEQVWELAREDTTVLTGKQTIYQMIRLAERVEQFGGSPKPPAEYKAEYNRRLMAHIADRRDALATGKAAPDEMMVRGARAMLDALRARGLTLYLASGTDEPYVREEAALLGLTDRFDGGIHGAREDYKTFSKAMVIQRIIADHDIAGPELLGVGDGFVEITNTREVGGYALGVATDELAGGGRMDEWKRRRLTEAGADMLVPDFEDTDGICRALFGQES